MKSFITNIVINHLIKNKYPLRVLFFSSKVNAFLCFIVACFGDKLQFPNPPSRLFHNIVFRYVLKTPRLAGGGPGGRGLALAVTGAPLVG